MVYRIFLVIIAGLTANHVFKLIDKLGYLRHFHQHHPGPCRTVPGVSFGSEDFAVTSQGDVFITTGLAWAFHSPGYTEYAKRKNIQGGILLFQFNKPDKVARLKFKASNTFNQSLFKPHGLDMIEDKTNGEHILFVVSHPLVVPDRIEKFRYRPKTKELEHIKTYTHEKFRNLNDVAVVGPESFYTTNMGYSTGRITAMMETLALFKRGSVLHYSNGDVEEVVPYLFMPNGITLSKDTRSLYVSVGEFLHLYARHSNGTLGLVQEVEMHTQVDNIKYDKEGTNLFIGSHPKLHKFLEYDEDPENSISPSQVVVVPLKDGRFQEEQIHQLMYDNGSLITGSSVATVWEGKLLIGTVQDKLAMCQLSHTNAY